MIVALCSVVALLAAPSLAQGSGGSTLTSPCPRVFRYAPPGIEPGLWAGVATLSSDKLLYATSLNLNIVLDRPALGFGQLWHLVGYTTTYDNANFVIYNDDLQIQPNQPLVVRFYVQYDPLNTTPRLREMRLNGRVICDADTYWRATVDRPALSNVRQPSSSSSDPKIRINLSMKPLKSTQTDNNPVYQRSNNTFSIAVINPIKPTIQPSSETVECGVVSQDNEGVTLFYRGMNYTRGDIPWLVAIYARQKNAIKFICGGTLVSDRHVVTAASCMLRRAAQTAIKDIVVKVGAHFLSDWSDDVTVSRGLVAISIHEDYNPSTLENNILMLSLKKRVKFGNYIRPACLWSGDTELSRVVGATGVVAGWGVKSEEGTGQHDDPHKVLVPIVSTSRCRASKPTFYNLTSDKTLCAGARNGVGPCVGDSGAGLYLQENGRWRLRGVVSLYLREEESSECNLNEYVVYTDTAQYLTWIRNVLSVQYID